MIRRRIESKSITILLALICLAACGQRGPAEATLSPQARTFSCAFFLAQTSPDTLNCISINADSVVLQTQATTGTQVTINLDGVTVTFNDTLYVAQDEPERTIILGALDGVVVAGINGLTRILQRAMQITLSVESTADPSALSPVPLNLPALQATDLSDLPRPIILPEIVTPPAEATEEMSLTESCPEVEGWTGTYTIRRGDTLSSVAARAGVTIEAIQTANCLSNPDVLSPGQTLRVPASADTADAASFTVEPDTIRSGECATISWVIENAGLVYFEGEPAAHAESRSACPLRTATYTLLVIFTDGAQVGYTTTLNVTEP